MPRVTSKGQVTIPKEIRDELGLRSGSEVEFVREKGGVMLRRRIPDEALDRALNEWQGYLRGKLLAPTVDETMELLRGERYSEADAPLESPE
jgi:antitoxin PrlF